MKEKIKITELEKGTYYRFHYNDSGYIIAKSETNSECFFGIKDKIIHNGDKLWPSRCNFGASNYATLAPEEEIAWLDHCIKSGEHITLASFMKDYYTPAEVSNYPIF
jgi:hypothetical protein